MSFRDLRPALLRDVLAGTHQRQFDTARGRHPALASHETVLSVLEVLGEPRATYPEKEALVRALIEEYQRSKHTLWATALLIALSPMLCRLSAQLGCGALTQQDLDQVLVLSFLEAVAEYPLGGEQRHTFLFLRRATRRRLLTWLARERREQSLVSAKERDELQLLERRLVEQRRELAWPATEEQHSERLDTEAQNLLAAFLVERLGHEIDAGSLQLVIATFVHGKRLRSLAGQDRAGVPRELHGRTYQRLKRRHSRTVRRVRMVLAGFLRSASGLAPRRSTERGRAAGGR